MPDDADKTQHIVYVGTADQQVSHVLDVVEGHKERRKSMDKWWKAFKNGEKKPPEGYEAIHHMPVSDFVEWPEGNDAN